MATTNLEKIDINNSRQWVLVRGKSLDAPLVIYVQAGPGFPIIPEADELEKLFHLEADYLVAYWDQRACGKSFDEKTDPKTINFTQLTDDVIACTQYLLRKYKKDKAILIGHSIGATLSLLAAAKDSSLFRELFLIGIDIDVPCANQYALEFALNKAKATGNKRLVQQVIALEKMPIVEAGKFQQRAKLLTNMGGIKTGSNYHQLVMNSIKNMLFSKAYRLSDISKTAQGMKFSQNALLPELNTLNLFHKITSINVPVHFIQGKLDSVAPYEIALKFYHHLQADRKTFTDFEHSAHMPHYEEPGKFRKLLKDTITN